LPAAAGQTREATTYIHYNWSTAETLTLALLTLLDYACGASGWIIGPALCAVTFKNGDKPKGEHHAMPNL
jgi:hypothetical protein